MFGIDKERLIANLKIMKKDVCAYGREYNRLCDCKYGKDEKHHTPLSEAFSGCCELTMAILLLESMSEDLFNNLCTIGKVSLPCGSPKEQEKPNMIPTMDLYWKMEGEKGARYPILYQKWKDPKTNEIEWRNVPVESCQKADK